MTNANLSKYYPVKITIVQTSGSIVFEGYRRGGSSNSQAILKFQSGAERLTLAKEPNPNKNDRITLAAELGKNAVVEVSMDLFNDY